MMKTMMRHPSSIPQWTLLFLAVLLMSMESLIAFSPVSQKRSNVSSKLFYVRDQPPSPAIITPLDDTITAGRTGVLTKPKIRDIKSMDEFKYFLEEDDRPVAVK